MPPRSPDLDSRGLDRQPLKLASERRRSLVRDHLLRYLGTLPCHSRRIQILNKLLRALDLLKTANLELDGGQLSGQPLPVSKVLQLILNHLPLARPDHSQELTLASGKVLDLGVNARTWERWHSTKSRPLSRSASSPRSGSLSSRPRERPLRDVPGQTLRTGSSFLGRSPQAPAGREHSAHPPPCLETQTPDMLPSLSTLELLPKVAARGRNLPLSRARLQTPRLKPHEQRFLLLAPLGGASYARRPADRSSPYPALDRGFGASQADLGPVALTLLVVLGCPTESRGAEPRGSSPTQTGSRASGCSRYASWAAVTTEFSVLGHLYGAAPS